MNKEIHTDEGIPTSASELMQSVTAHLTDEQKDELESDEKDLRQPAGGFPLPVINRHRPRRLESEENSVLKILHDFFKKGGDSNG